MYFRDKIILNLLQVSRWRLKLCGYCSVADNTFESQYNNVASKFFSINEKINCLVVQPYIKWGRSRKTETTPELQLAEAVSLVRSLNNWTVAGHLITPLTSFEKTHFFGSGTLDKIQHVLQTNSSINALFISVSLLKLSQLCELEKLFEVAVFDRYKIVVNILRLHALSAESKLQVSLAEIPYLRSQINHPIMITAGKTESARKNVLQLKENKVKKQLEKLRSQRNTIRKRRVDNEIISVSVIGYTNSGKTSLIRALTSDAKLQPKDCLFATLDVSTYMGVLPSKLPVLYTDTVGFMADIPTNLMECFIATLEDAFLSDVIIHVMDASHPDLRYQNQHVLRVMNNLSKKISSDSDMNNNLIINVANKCDLKKMNDFEFESGTHYVSSITFQGIDKLKVDLETLILKVTNRKKIKIRARSGSDETRWLYANGTVVLVSADQNDPQYSVLTVILSESRIKMFQNYFIKKKDNSQEVITSGH